MSSTKRYNPSTEKWEVIGTSHASDIGVVDLEENFKSKNAEGVFRELAETNKELSKDTNSLKTSLKNTNSHVSKLKADFEEHITNHPGGSGSSSACKITSTFEGGVVDSDTDLYIPIFFTPSPGATGGTAYIMINDIEVGMQVVERGNNRVHIGVLPSIKNEIAIYVKDSKGNLSDMLYWSVVKGGIEFTLNFDYNADYSIEDVIRCPYTISSPLDTELILEVTVDNVKKEIPIKKQGAGEYIFEGLGIGVHTVTMIVTSGIYRSKMYKFNLVIVSSYNLYVSSTFEGGEFEFGVPIIVDYRISKLSSETFTVNLILDDIVQKTVKVPSGVYTWTISNLGVGSHVIKIEASSDQGELVSIERSLSVYVGEYVPVQPVDSGLLLELDARVMTNNDEEKNKWYNEQNVDVTLHNFNYRMNGWIEDTLADGSTERVLRCDNEAYVEIDLKPFKDNAKLGCTIDLLYKAKNIGLEEARVIDYTDVESPYKGIYANVTETVFKSATNTGTVYLDEDTEIRLTFVIDRVNKFGLIYVNGVINRPFYLSDSGSGVNAFYEDFTHDQKIYLNSEKGLKNFGACDIKRLRVYGRALSSDEVIQNHLADIENINTQRERYKFNFENKTTPAIKMYASEESLGNMTDTISVPVRIKYESPNEDFYGASFDLPSCDVTLQGTSSLQYVLKNYTARLKDENLAEYMYTPYKNGVPESVYCFKADYMESSHANNVGMAKFINDCVYDSKTPAQLIDSRRRTAINGFPVLLYINDKLQGAYNFNLDRYSTESYGYKDFPKMLAYEVSANSDTTAGAFHKWTSASGKTEIDYYKSDFECLYPPSRDGNDNFAEIIRLVNWVDSASDELFKEQISEYFNLEYLLRYYLTVMVVGAVDNLGKNMKLVTYDGLIWYPQFYDLDTILGLDNTGFLKFGSDIEVEAGIFNTSGSKLWEKVRRLFAVELQQQYALMRLDRFTVNNMMKYLHGEQISAIPERVYNMDMQTKYLDFGPTYLYACHGNREQHMKKWIRERLVYCDTLMKYMGSTNDYITLRSNKLGHVYLDLETYLPMYLTVKWRDEPDTIVNGEVVNHGKQTKRVGKGEKVRFEFNMPTETDQEIIIYAGRYLKSLGDVSNLQPTTMLLANASKLTAVKCNSPKLINTDLSKLMYVQDVDLSGCTKLGSGLGAQPTLDLSNCRYLKKLNVTDTQLTAVYTNLTGGSIEEIYYPNTIQAINLRNQERLRVIGVPYGYKNLAVDKSNIRVGEAFSIHHNNEGVIVSLDTLDNTFGFLDPTYLQVEPEKEYVIYSHNVACRHYYWVTICYYDENLNLVGSKRDVFQNGIAVGSSLSHSFTTPSDCKYVRYSIYFNKWGSESDGYYEGEVQLNDFINNMGLINSDQYEVFIECTSLANVDIQNCPNVERLSSYPQAEDVNTFLAIKHTQRLTLKNALKIDRMDFGAFKRLLSVTLSDMQSLVSCGFDDMNNVGDTGQLGNVTIQNCPKIRTLTMNVSSADKSIVFSNGATLDLSQAYTLNRIESNTPVIGLNTIILNRDIRDIILANKFNSEVDGDIKNLWSYSVATQNQEEGYEGIDFRDLEINNLDLSTAKRIINNRNFNVNMDGIFIVNQVRDGVIYPFMKFNSTINLTNYTGSYVGLFKDADLTDVTFICNKDIEATDFTSMFEGATIGDCDLTPILNRIKNAKTLTRMFKGSDISIVHPQIVDNPNAIMTGMYQDCNNIQSLDDLHIRSKGCTSMFLNCKNITTARNMNISTGSMQNFFTSCSALETIEGMTILKCDSLNATFRDTKKLNSVDLIIPDGCVNMFNMLAGSGVVESRLTIPDSVNNIEGLFQNCNKLLDISGTIIGRGITTKANWCPPNLITANEITIKSSGVTFENHATLTSCNNFTFDGDNMGSMFSECVNLAEVNNLVITSNCTNLYKAFYGCTSLSSLDFENCDLTNVVNISYIFRLSGKLREVSNFVIGNKVTTFEYWLYQTNNLVFTNLTVDADILTTGLFKGDAKNYVYKLHNLTLTSSITTMESAFLNCVNAEEITFSDNCDTSNVVSLFSTFRGCTNLRDLDVSGLDFSQVRNMSNTFNGIPLLTKTPIKLIPDSVTTIDGLFMNNTSLTDLSGMTFGSGITSFLNWVQNAPITKLNNVTFGKGYFGGSGMTRGLTTLEYANNLYVGGQNQDYSWILGGCTNLKEVSFREGTANPIGLSNAFYRCSKLEKVDLTNLDTSKCTRLNETFYGCELLTNETLIGNINLNSMVEMVSSFCNCRGLVNPPVLNIPDSVKKISNLFLGCVSLNNLDNFTVGSGVTVADSWISNAPIVTANNVTIKNEATKFTNCATLVECSNLTITDNVGSLQSLFQNCVKLTTMTFSETTNLELTRNYWYVFQGCTALTTTPIKLINNNSYMMYSSCGITEVDGMIFTEGATHLTNFFTNSLVTTLRNITFDVADCNLVIDSVKGTLQRCIDVTITSKVTTLSAFFRDCAKLRELTFSDKCDTSNVLSLGSTFLNCSELGEIDFTHLNLTGTTTMIDCFRGLKRGCIISNITLSDKLNLAGMERVFYSSSSIIRNIYIPTNLVAQKIFQHHSFPHTSVQEVSGIRFAPEVTDITGMLKGAKLLTTDFEIPSHIQNVTECFKDCTGITHIHSNWNNEYDSEIIATDCYSGCTNITHIDGENVIPNEYTTGLDEVPVVWGGYGFSKGTTGIYEFTIPNDNYTIDFKNNIYSELIEEGTINWGDGESSRGTMDHTYSTAGTYIVKAKIGTNNEFSETVRNCITKCFQLPTSYTKYSRTFSRCVNLTYVSIKDVTMIGQATFSQTGNLTTLILDNITFVDSLLDWFRWSGITEIDLTKCKFINIVTMQYAFYFATKLTGIKFPSDFDTSKVTSLAYAFSSCDVLTDLNIEGWDLSNVTTMAAMFMNCKNLKRVTMSANTPKLITMAQMFHTCTNLVEAPMLNTSKVQTFGGNNQGVFQGCKLLTEVPEYDFSNALYVSRMFESCTNLRRFKCINCSNKIQYYNDGYNNWSSMFINCTELVSIEGLNLEGLDYTKGYKGQVTANGTIAYNCPKLTDIILKEGSIIKVIDTSDNPYRGVNFRDCANISKQSLLNIINALYDYTGDSTRVLEIESKNIAKLSNSEILIATNKNWTII